MFARIKASVKSNFLILKWPQVGFVVLIVLMKFFIFFLITLSFNVNNYFLFLTGETLPDSTVIV